MSKKHSLSRKKWWAGLTEEERAAINQKRSETVRKRWEMLTPEEREELKRKMRKGKGMK